MSDVTRNLCRIEQGDPRAAEELLPLESLQGADGTHCWLLLGLTASRIKRMAE